MVKVVATNRDITFDGHAGYDFSGRDIVCTAISMILQVSVNAILEFDSECDRSSIYYVHKPENNNFAKLEILNHTEYNKKIIKNMMEMLEDIEKQYPNNIKIERKEVN